MPYHPTPAEKAVNRTLRARMPIRAIARQVNARARRNGFQGLGAFSQSPMAVAVRTGLKVEPKEKPLLYLPGNPYVQPVIDRLRRGDRA
ncbi:MAG TPA: hypothetical protein VGK73_32175 [Polyangiaceae bacterium]